MRNRAPFHVNALWILLLGATLSLASCESSTKSEEADGGKGDGASEVRHSKDSTRKSEFGVGDAPKKSSVDEDVIKATEMVKDNRTVNEKFLPKKENKRQEMKKAAPFYEAYLKAGKDEAVAFKMQFDAIPVELLVETFAAKESLGFGYVLDPQVKGGININVDTKLTKKEIWQLFEHILWVCGAYCTPDTENILHITPFANMPKQRNFNFTDQSGSNVQVALVNITHASAAKLMEKIKPFMTNGAQAIEVASLNAILLVETPANIPKIRDLINILDQKDKADWPQVALPCSNIPADVIKTELAAILPVLGFPVTVDSVVAEPGSIHLTSVDRLQVLVASAANQEAIDEIVRWVNILDRSDVGEQDRVFVYKVINSEADYLKQSLETIFTIEGKTISPSKSSSSSSATGGTTSGLPGTSGSGMGSNPLSAPPAPTAPTKAGTKGATGSKNSANVFEVPTKLLADGVNNRLVIRTTPRTYAMMKAVLDRLDTVASQVLLQVILTEVNLDESTQYGVEFSSKLGQKESIRGTNEIFGTKWNDPALIPPTGDNIGSVPSAQDGFTWQIADKRDPSKTFAYLRAAAGESNLKVLACPQIITTSDNIAFIQVGQQIPILVGQNQAQDTTNVFNQIKYVDTGIITEITPHVTKGGLITLEIKQTLSDSKPTTDSKIDSPTIIKREFKTKLSLRDGHTLLVGGLIQNNENSKTSNLPFLINLPVFGKLVGDNSLSSKRIEILMLITATMIDEKSDIESMIMRYKNSMDQIRKFNDDAESFRSREEIKPGSHEEDSNWENEMEVLRINKRKNPAPDTSNPDDAKGTDSEAVTIPDGHLPPLIIQKPGGEVDDLKIPDEFLRPPPVGDVKRSEPEKSSPVAPQPPQAQKPAAGPAKGPAQNKSAPPPPAE